MIFQTSKSMFHVNLPGCSNPIIDLKQMFVKGKEVPFVPGKWFLSWAGHPWYHMDAAFICIVDMSQPLVIAITSMIRKNISPNIHHRFLEKWKTIPAISKNVSLEVFLNASNIFYRVATFWRSGSLLNPWLLWQCLPAFQFFDKKNLRPSKKAQGRSYLEKPHKPAVSFPAWRIIPVSKWLVNPICKPFRPLGRGTTLLRGLTNHGYKPLTKWDDPLSGVQHWRGSTVYLYTPEDSDES